MKIYFVQITWHTESTIGKVIVSLERDVTLPSFSKEVTIDKKTKITCGPPLPARYLRIERKKEALKISEVEVRATGNS